MKPTPFVITLLLLAGCTVSPTLLPTTDTTAGPSPSVAPSPSAASSAPPIAGLTFRALTEGDLQALPDQYPPGGTSQSPEFRPLDESLYGVTSGNYDWSCAFGSYQVDGQPYALQSVTIAETPGQSGGLQARIDADVLPVVQAWASDAQLLKDYQRPRLSCAPPYMPCVSDTVSPSDVADPATILKNFGPPLIYDAASLRESLVFFPSTATQRIYRLTWAPQGASATNVKIDQAAAIERLEGALEDPKSKSWEERHGVDYVFGVPFHQAQPGDPIGLGNVVRVEPLTQLPTDLHWTAELDASHAGKPMWHLTYESPSPPAPGSWSTLTMRGDGWVDADTGEVIRFSRPHRDDLGPSPSPISTPSPFVQ